MRLTGQSNTEQIEPYKERLHIALSAAKICIFEVDLPRQLYTFFENAEIIFGVSGEKILRDVQPFSLLEPEEYRRQVSRYFSHPDDEEVIAKAFASVLKGEPAVYEARMKAGQSAFVWCRIHVTPILEDGRPVRMIGVVTDITDIKEKTDRLKKAANLDRFTGLYNKDYAATVIQDILSKDNRQHALVLLDIDNFKSFNDTYGHDEGDKILKAISRRIKRTFRQTDVGGRFGGDEFIVLVQNLSDDAWLRDTLAGLTRFQVDDFVCTTSIGVSLFPQDAGAFQELFKKADQALYHAKTQKEAVTFFAELSGR